jgi:ABC-2 type transporter
MSLVKYYTKGILTNRNLWFWGVAFMIFWLFLYAFSFASQVPDTQPALLQFSAISYGSIALFSLSSLAISIAYSIYYASSSLAYSFRFTKLTPISYVGSLIGSSSALGVILSAIMIVCTFGIFSVKFGFNLAPSNAVAAFGVSALAGIFMMALSMLLVLVVVNYLGLQNVSLVTFVPLILAFGFGLAAINSVLPIALLYASPYNAVQSLLYMVYSGQAPHVQLTDPTSPVLNWLYLLASMGIWITLLLSLDSVLLRRLKPRQVEEGRQI